MSKNNTGDRAIYKVVVNHEEQYSIWPADRENPLGWRDAGMRGTQLQCFAYIKKNSKPIKPPKSRALASESKPPSSTKRAASNKASKKQGGKKAAKSQATGKSKAGSKKSTKS